jgi:hypothetical protein|tara:strand:+ start:1110 stop:1544 length:435 start_codon:yes stop_codon:yes gene_type:complete
MAEPIPVDILLGDLDTQWNASNVTEPIFIEVTGANEPARFNLNRGDFIIGSPGSPAFMETPIGNWKYVRREYNIELAVHTRVSRQRLYDLMAEVRRICHARRHSFSQFQRVQFQQFSEDVTEQVNIWVGNISIQFVNEDVLAEI